MMERQFHKYLSLNFGIMGNYNLMSLMGVLFLLAKNREAIHFTFTKMEMSLLMIYYQIQKILLHSIKDITLIILTYRFIIRINMVF